MESDDDETRKGLYMSVSFVGDVGVGKTTLLCTYVYGNTNENLGPFYEKQLVTKNNTVLLSMWNINCPLLLPCGVNGVCFFLFGKISPLGKYISCYGYGCYSNPNLK